MESYLLWPPSCPSHIFLSHFLSLTFKPHTPVAKGNIGPVNRKTTLSYKEGVSQSNGCQALSTYTSKVDLERLLSTDVGLDSQRVIQCRSGYGPGICIFDKFPGDVVAFTQ